MVCRACGGLSRFVKGYHAVRLLVFIPPILSPHGFLLATHSLSSSNRYRSVANVPRRAWHAAWRAPPPRAISAGPPPRARVTHEGLHRIIADERGATSGGLPWAATTECAAGRPPQSAHRGTRMEGSAGRWRRARVETAAEHPSEKPHGRLC
jgi:hypothetical protein